MRIPLSLSRLVDEKIWHGESNGAYSVKIAFKILTNKFTTSMSGSSVQT